MKSLICLGLFLSGSLYAHVPYVEGLDFEEGEDYVVKGPVEQSLALYLSFNSPDDVDQTEFTLTADDLKPGQDRVVMDEEGKPARTLTLSTLVPACSAYADILPRLALIGPAQKAIPELQSDAMAEIPVALVAGQGAALIVSEDHGEKEKEPIAGTNYWNQQERSWLVTEPGSYRIAVWEPQGLTGDYVLVFGKAEIFEFSDVVQAVRRIAFLRKGEEIADAACRTEAKK